MVNSGVTRWRGLDWPAEMPIHQRHLWLWKKWRENPFNKADLLNPVSEHLLEACRILFTPRQLVIHPWFETQAFSWTNDTFSVWWGCAGSGKSHSLGLFTLLDYLADPDCTFSLLASTTKEMLSLRSFASVVQYLDFLKQNGQFLIPFKHIGTPMCVVPDNTSPEQALDVKCKILGVAVQQGTQEQARQNLQGVHTRYVRLILDELEGLRPAAPDARNNLSQCFDFKFMAACNPESFYGLAGQFSEPKTGWVSVSDAIDKWETFFGTVYRFDAYKSPGRTDPDKYPFLPTESSIANIVKQNRGNEDAPAVWTFLKAFPPPQGLERTLLTEQEIVSYDMKGTCVWKEPPVKVAGFDPAFTADGDNAVLQTALVGTSSMGVLVIKYDKTFYLKILASSKVPVREQLVNQVSEILRDEGIDLLNFAVDDSGLQGVADALEMKLGVGVFRVSSIAKPPKLPVSPVNPVTADEKFLNTVTWSYTLVHDYGMYGQIKGLPNEAARQLCLRRVLPKAKPIGLETKKDFKRRCKFSPDEADACAVLAALCRQRLGIMPGTSVFAPEGARPATPFSSDQDVLARSFNNLDLDISGRYRLDGGV